VITFAAHLDHLAADVIGLARQEKGGQAGDVLRVEGRLGFAGEEPKRRLRGDEPRCDAVHLHLVLARLGRQSPRERFDGFVGHIIVQPAGCLVGPGEAARELKNLPRPLLDHVGQELSRQQHRCRQPHPHHLTDLSLRGRRQAGAMVPELIVVPDAHGIHQDVHPPERERNQAPEVRNGPRIEKVCAEDLRIPRAQ
jgi:hypothetical protein